MRKLNHIRLFENFDKTALNEGEMKKLWALMQDADENVDLDPASPWDAEAALGWGIAAAKEYGRLWAPDEDASVVVNDETKVDMANDQMKNFSEADWGMLGVGVNIDAETVRGYVNDQYASSEEEEEEEEDVIVYDNNGKTADRYLVIIGNDAYNMSHNATSANGVNMYAGERKDLGDLEDGTHGRKIPYDSLPDDVKTAIKQRKNESTDEPEPESEED